MHLTQHDLSEKQLCGSNIVLFCETVLFHLFSMRMITLCMIPIEWKRWLGIFVSCYIAQENPFSI